MFDGTSMCSPFSRLFLILLFLHRLTVHGRTLHPSNITIDDSDSRISYSPGWNDCKTLNTEHTEFGKRCHWSDRGDAYAEFTFIGVAVYLVSPLWTYPVEVTLDSELSHLVELRDHFHENEWGGSKRREDIVWGVSGLENGTHTLRIEKGEHAQYVVLEALIFTSATSISGPEMRYQVPRLFEASSPPDQTSILNASAPSIIALYRRSDQQSNQPVIIGAVVGLCIALVGVGLAIVFIRYRTRILAKYGHLVGIPTVVGDEMLPTDSTTLSPQMARTNFPTPLHAAFTAPSTEARDARPTVPGSDSGPKRETKALPSPPSQTSPITPTRKFARLTMLGSKRRALGPLTVEVIKSGDNPKTNPAKSTSSSFFPNPVHEEIYPTKHHRSSSVISQLDEVNEKPSQETSNPPPSRPVIHPLSTTAVRRPTARQEIQGKSVSNNWSAKHTSSSSGSTSADTSTPLSSSPEILQGRHPFPPRNSSKSVLVGMPLASIAETSNQGRSSVTDSPTSTKSARATFKRKSEGRTRVEKEKQQRRKHPRTLVSPSGPRDRFGDTSSRPSSRILSYPPSPARASMIADSKLFITTARRLPRPLPPRPIPPSSDNRPETPLPPYAIGSDILPLYFEKSKPISRRSLRPPAVSATSNKHFLPSPPPSATSSSDATPDHQPNPPSRPLPVVIASRLSPRQLPVPNRPRALTDSSTPTLRLPIATHIKQNRSVDLPPSSQQEVPKEQKPKVNQVKPKKSSDSSTSAVSSVSSSQRRVPSKTAPFTTMQMKNLSEHERHPPSSVPVTPNMNSWSDSGTYRYTKSIPEVDDDTTKSDGGDQVSLSRYQLLPAPPLPSTTPLNLVSKEKKKRLGRVPPPLVEINTFTLLDVQEEDPLSHRTPTASRTHIPPPPHSAPPYAPPSTPPTPRRRGKVWDDTGRKRGDRITPSIREASLLGTPSNKDGSAYSV